MNPGPNPWKQPPTAYAGIGSRETPPDILTMMTRLARKLGGLGWVLRSGGAPGADEAFESGAVDALEREIYLPWPGFNNPGGTTRVAYVTPAPAAFELAARFHPGWAGLGRGARALLARNGHQVLGKDLKSPSAFILCWTPDGAFWGTSMRTGGTGQAIRIANFKKIPVFNLKRQDHYDLWNGFLEDE